jgi:hypothetical protein
VLQTPVNSMKKTSIETTVFGVPMMKSVLRGGCQGVRTTARVCSWCKIGQRFTCREKGGDGDKRCRDVGHSAPLPGQSDGPSSAYNDNSTATFGLLQ